jgi:glycerol-3-phosphate acyltransferase PlsY
MEGLPAGMALIGASFIIGAIPWGFVFGQIGAGIDLRTVGSGGTGATNVLRALGLRASVIVLTLDFLKGCLPVLAASRLGYGEWWTSAAGVAAVVGHCWSPFIGFKGGKGMATGAGAAIALLPQTLLVLPFLVGVVWRTRYVSLGSLVATMLGSLLAVGLAMLGQASWPTAVAILAIAAIIFVRHAANIERLAHGTERRIGEKVAS